MPLYFFHTEGRYMRIDEEGTELADPKAARIEAVRTAGEVLREAGFVVALMIYATMKLGDCG